jgi:hypothetical protein
MAMKLALNIRHCLPSGIHTRPAEGTEGEQHAAAAKGLLPVNLRDDRAGCKKLSTT